jgi:hypothetical protein
MKKRLIVGAVLVACTIVLTLINGLAQAQSLSSPPMGVEEDEGQAERLTEDAITPQFVDPNRFFTGVCTIGPRSGDAVFTCFDLGFTNSIPRLVLCQTRNHPSEPVDFSDQFACQVTRTSIANNGSVTVRIRRIDDGTTASGWGQNLQINLLIVE